MRVAVSVTKVFETDARDLKELRVRMEFLNDGNSQYIDWYDIEAKEEEWSYCIVGGD